jgi:hypothetical protein
LTTRLERPAALLSEPKMFGEWRSVIGRRMGVAPSVLRKRRC